MICVHCRRRTDGCRGASKARGDKNTRFFTHKRKLAPILQSGSQEPLSFGCVCFLPLLPLFFPSRFFGRSAPILLSSYQAFQSCAHDPQHSGRDETFLGHTHRPINLENLNPSHSLFIHPDLLASSIPWPPCRKQACTLRPRRRPCSTPAAWRHSRPSAPQPPLSADRWTPTRSAWGSGTCSEQFQDQRSFFLLFSPTSCKSHGSSPGQTELVW